MLILVRNKSILRQVVNNHGTASLAEVTVTLGVKLVLQKKCWWQDSNTNLLVSVFPSIDPEYILLVYRWAQAIPQVVYNYRGKKFQV